MNLYRRKIAVGGAAAFVASLLALRPGHTLAVTNRAAFDANKLQDSLQLLGATRAVDSRDIVISAPDMTENSAFVPVQITSKIAGTQSISILVDRNPWPLIARFEFADNALPFVALRLRMAETSPLRVVVTASGSHYVATKEVRAAAGGCGGGTGPDGAAVAMTKGEAMKIRAKAEGGITDLRALLSHPMENGLRKDPAGKIVPEHFIQQLDVGLNGKTVIEAQIGRSVSSNPLFTFKVSGANPRDKFTLTWRDNRGLTRTDEASVSA